MSKKKTDNNTMPLDNLRSRRKEKGYTQQAIADLIITGQDEAGDNTTLGQDTYSDYELGKTPIPSHILIQLSNILGVSCDYILGMPNAPLNIGNKEIEDMTGLNEQAIENLRMFKDHIIEQVALAVVASEYGITHTPYNPIDTLNMIINSPTCEGLLYAIEDYISPEYNKPMCFLAAGEKVGGVTTKKADYHIPTNQVHKKPRRDPKGHTVYDNYLPLVKDENTPTDYRALHINDSFLESVAMLQIQKYIDTIKADHLAEKLAQ